MDVAIIGTGRVGTALARGLSAAGHRVVFGSRAARADSPVPGVPVHDHATAVAGAEVIVLAVPFASAPGLVRGLGDLGERVLVDATNPIGADTGGGTGAEVIAAAASGARVVKAFNTVGAEQMTNAAFPGGRAYALLAADDQRARDAVAGLAGDLGFEPVHLGDLSTAGHAEAAARLWIHLATASGYGRGFAIGLLRR